MHAIVSCNRIAKRLLANNNCLFGSNVLFSNNAPFSTSAKESVEVASKVPKEADIVVIGGGIIGCSVAYHLASLGLNDVVVLEQGEISCGTTWHAAGLVGKMRSTQTETILSNYGSKLYSNLEKETSLATGWKQCGSVTVARCDERLTLLRRNASKARAFGVEAHIVSAKEAGELWPLLKTDDLVGALYLPEDGSVDPSDLCQSLARGARNKGVQIIQGVEVERVHTTNDSIGSNNKNDANCTVTGVSTSKGDISARVVVNCAGQWARDIGKLSNPNVAVPLHSAEHFYVVTKPLKTIEEMNKKNKWLPIMRDPDGWTYYREWGGGLCVGGFEELCKPCFHDDPIPNPFHFQLLPDDWDHFSVLMEQALLRIPELETAEIRQMINGPESFTPDNAYILGEAPNLDNYFVAAGMNSSGIASAAGAGVALADWIATGNAPMDLWAVDIRRFSQFHNNKTFLRERTLETLGLHYQIPWPKRELESARGLRKSSLYETLDNNGAVWGEKLGWERANWFAPAGTERKNQYTFNRQNWFDIVGEEVKCCRESVGLMDISSFAKFEISGPTAVSFLQRVCSNNLDVPIGKVVYTALLNDRGGFETDCTITRTSQDTFMMISPTQQAVRDLHWLTKQLSTTDNVKLQDVTSSFTVLSVMGPKSRQLLEHVAPFESFDNKHFAFGTSKQIDIANATARASRISYVGELGWELYIQPEFARGIYDSLVKAGNSLNVQVANVGYYAIDSMRIEKGYRAWGHDVTPDTTPIEAGLSFAVDFSKNNFNGKEALLKQQEDGIKKKLVFFTIDCDAELLHESPPLWGGEAIMRNGTVVGFTTSASHSYMLNKQVCMAYITNNDANNESNNNDNNKNSNKSLPINKSWILEGEYSIDVSGTIVPAKAILRSPFDPKNKKLQA